MNTLPKSLAIAILAVSIFISGLSADFVGAQNTAVGAAASRHPADLLQSQYLRFGRITTENGLSNDTISVDETAHPGLCRDKLVTPESLACPWRILAKRHRAFTGSIFL